MTTIDEDHLKELFAKELQAFLESTKDCLNTVLVFPCINSYSRLKLHELTKEKYPSELVSFSVGVEPERKPVICRQQLIANWTLKSAATSPPSVTVANAAQDIKSSKRPEKALYVPRALRGKEVQAQAPPPVIKTWQDEVHAMTGPVKLLPPLSDYLAIEAGCINPEDNAFRRVIELGDFPKELKTSDLESALFSGLVKINDYYDLRWVDDTHALVIFSDEITAAKALGIVDAQIKFRPFYQACSASKSKAKTFDLEQESEKRSRPNTSTVMARRLLSRALNNPDIKAKPEDEQILKDAKKLQKSK